MADEGYERLWHWFGLSRASWITIPRILAHEMPDEWQNKMAELLEQYDETWNFESIELNTYVVAKKGNRFSKIPSWILNYRHPDQEKIEKIKEKDIEHGTKTNQA